MKTLRIIFYTAKTFFQKAGIVNQLLLIACLVSASPASPAQEIKMYSGINLVLDGNIYFVVNNTAFKNDGNFTAGASTVKFTGNTDTTIGYLSGNSYTKFNNLTLDKSAYGIAIKSAAGVKNILTVSAGTLYPDSNLTLLSDITNTARLAVVPSGATISGKAMIERYIPSKRAWRLMTAPVTDGSSIYNSWQNKGVYTVGRGLLVSSPVGGNGLDNTNASSLKTWNVATQVLVSVTNTYASSSASANGSADNRGYFVFIRGDRNTINYIVPNTNITTLTSIGRFQTGTQVFNSSAVGGGYTLIGNPYASPIDFNAVTRVNLLKRFYVWDPSLNTLGGYVTLDDLDNNGIFSKSISSSSQTKEIQSSQAFFVETNVNGAASLTIGENAKSTVNNTPIFRPIGQTAGEGTSGSINTNLFLLNADNSVVLADGTLVEFADGFHDGVSNEDAIKFANINESIGMLRNGSVLAIERRPLINITDTVFFKVWKTTQRNYQLKISPENVYKDGMVAFFEDSYLATSVPISLTEVTFINFTVDGNAASAVDSRFRIIFKPAIVLPISFSAIKAYQLKESVKVDWQASDEINVIKYEVEKSANGLSFVTVGATIKDNAGKYSWLDPAPFTGRNFYRIKSIGSGGEIKYSPIVNVTMENNAMHFTIASNPMRGNAIHLRFANQAKGNYQFNLFNNAGQVVFSSKLLVSGNATSAVLNTNAVLPAGIYQLQVAGPANDKETLQLIIKD